MLSIVLQFSNKKAEKQYYICPFTYTYTYT